MVHHFLPFLAGERENDAGDTVHTMLGLDDDQMRKRRNWVQWCFPVPHPPPSQLVQHRLGHNEAALISACFASRVHVHALLLKVFAFWGIRWVQDGTMGGSLFSIADAERFCTNMGTGNHKNQTRMTRVITFLFALGWSQMGKALQHFLSSCRYEVVGFDVSDAMLAEWEEPDLRQRI